MTKILIALLIPVCLWAQDQTFPALGLNLSGFVDGSSTRNLSQNEGTFSFDQAEIDLEKTLGARGFFRVDIEYRGGATIANAADYVEQGFMQYTPSGKANSLTFTFGRFNAPIGFESPDPVDMLQYSNGLLFTYGTPTNLTGLMALWQPRKWCNLKAYAVNGWDLNTDNNSGVTVGGRFGVCPSDKLCFGIAGITGPEQETNESDVRTVVDADLAYTPLSALTVGAELNSGSEDVAGQSFKWSGAQAVAHYDFNAWLGLTGRIGTFNDSDGLRTGIGQTLSDITVAPTFVLGDNMTALIEYRQLGSDQNFWTDDNGSPSKSSSAFAFEATFSF